MFYQTLYHIENNSHHSEGSHLNFNTSRKIFVEGFVFSKTTVGSALGLVKLGFTHGNILLEEEC